MKKKFVILCFPRTGSYYLVDILTKQKDVYCHGEIFKPNFVELNSEILSALNFQSNDTKKRDNAPLLFMKSVYDKTSSPIVGFKFFANHNYHVKQHILFKSDLKKIFLTRNPIQTLISQKLAQQTGKWVLKTGEEPQNFKTFLLKKFDIIGHLLWMKSFYESALAANKLSTTSNFYFLDYSELFDRKKLERLAAFLDIEKWDDPVEKTYTKQLNKPYSEVIENWNDVYLLLNKLGIDEKMPFIQAMTAFNKSVYINPK